MAGTATAEIEPTYGPLKSLDMIISRPPFTDVAHCGDCGHDEGCDCTCCDQAGTDDEPDPEVKCGGCRRPLTSPRSRDRGWGPVCWARALRRAREEAARDFTPAQIAKALQLLADRGLVLTGRPGVYQAVSGDGERVYQCTGRSCTCEWGSRGGRCYHQAGVVMIAVRRPAQHPAIALGMAA